MSFLRASLAPHLAQAFADARTAANLEPDVTSYGRADIGEQAHEIIPPTVRRTPPAPSEPVALPVAPAAPERPENGRENVSDMLDEINGLIRQWLAGEDVLLVAVELPPLDGASNNQAAVARFAAIVKGLWLGVDEPRPILLARQWVADWLADPEMARRVGLKRPITERTVGRCRDYLRNAGVLVLTDTVKIPGRPRPAHLYELATAAAINGRGVEVAGLRGQQPRDAAVDFDLVSPAEL